jgi:hypothetical protein
MKRWIQSFAGKQVFLAALRPEQVSLEDIPLALSRKIRFSGMTQGDLGYSVAQHCVIGSYLIAPPFALAFLLHEAGEVYLPDIPSPLKPMLEIADAEGSGCTRSWHDLESDHADAILTALGLYSIRPLLDAPEVKEMDLAMLAWEKREMMGPEPEPWNLTVPPPVGAGAIEPWPEAVARRDWLRRFHELTGTGPFARGTEAFKVLPSDAVW